ncbi:MAG: sigma-70 family RNA polymerase sigma factor [Roseivirga sp.]|nr:sigma-70 family RNA polymerase sigma factor [Roseivirga sp.]
MDHLLLELDTANGLFQQKLKDQHPKLTPYDLRLCTYLKSNLSTKEIAVLLNITPDSAKKAKHRLRKKLALQPTSSWTEVVKSVD